MRKKRRNKIGIFQKTVFPKKKVAVSVMLFAVLMQLVMQPMSVHASIQSASGKNAVPEVSYHGKEQSITFKNTDGIDLFQGFKNLMPGDVREQEMILKAKNITHETSFYLRAECDDETREILKDVRMDLYANDRLVVENGLILENVKLGTVSDKTSIQLKAVLKVPTSLGNEVAGREFPVKWYFSAQQDGDEIVSVSPSDPDAGQNNGIIQTGDESGQGLTLLLIVAGVSLLIIIVIVICKIFRKK